MKNFQNLFLLFILLSYASLASAQTNSCSSFFVDLSESKDSIFTSPPLNLTGKCCIDNDQAQCVKFFVNFSDQVNAFNFDITSDTILTDSSFYFNCSNPGQVDEVYCINDSLQSLEITYCSTEEDTLIFHITSIPKVEYQINTTPPLDSDVGEVFIDIDSSDVSSIIFDNGEMGPYANQLGIGNHTVEIIDKYGCSILDSFFIPCIGGQPLNIDVCPGSEPDIYLGESTIINSSGDTIFEITSQEIGVPLLIVNSDGCTTKLRISYWEETPIDISVKETCNGIPSVLVAGGGFASYLWNTGATTIDLEIREKGEYIVSGFDDNGCFASDTLSIEEESLDITIQGSSSFCENGNTTLTAFPENLNYEWNTGEVTQTIVVNTPGTYFVNVSTLDGCFGQGEITVDVDVIPEFQIVSEVQCPSNEFILKVDETFETYLWSTGASTKEIIINSAGIYQVSVTKNGCVQTREIEIEANLMSSLFSYDCNSEFEVLIGSHFEYLGDSISYIWSTGETEESIITNTSGTYYLSVSSPSGCFFNDSIIISDLKSLIIDPLITSDSISDSNSILLNTSGGVSPYTYVWSHDLTVNSASLENIEDGSYSVTITDSFGCTIEETFNVGSSSSIQEVSTHLLIYPNPVHNNLYIDNLTGEPLSTIQIFDSAGSLLFEANTNQGNLQINYIDVSSYERGIYFLNLNGHHVKKFVKVGF